MSTANWDEGVMVKRGCALSYDTTEEHRPQTDEAWERMVPTAGPAAGARWVALFVWCLLGLVAPLGALGDPTPDTDSFYTSPPDWEPLLWGGPVAVKPPPPQEGPSTEAAEASPPPQEAASTEAAEPPPPIQQASPTPPPPDEVAQPPSLTETAVETARVQKPPAETRLETIRVAKTGLALAGPSAPLLAGTDVEPLREYHIAPFRMLTLKNIPPLYTTPPLAGEGVWQSQDMPGGKNGSPILHKTSYRPSVEYPNATVHMLMLDIKRLAMNLYLGSTEPGAVKGCAVIESEQLPRLVAITNAFWKARHSGDAGTVFRGQLLKKLAPGIATMVNYTDGSVDILEWNDSIPLSVVRDAKQLRHLIVKDGRVVNSVVAGGQSSDSEIGLGMLLSENGGGSQQYGGYWGFWGWGGYGGGPSTTSGADWFIATRSAFGMRPDGTLVFAVGHHISTKDLAKALALAGCDRAIHGDANPHNVLGNIYWTDGNGSVVRKLKLSPDQKDYTLDRYFGRNGYTSDYYGFFLKDGERDSS